MPLPDSSSQEPLLVAGSFAGDTFHVPAYKVLNSSSSNGTVAVMGLSRLQVRACLLLPPWHCQRQRLPPALSAVWQLLLATC